MSAKRVRFGRSALGSIHRGIEGLADAVAVTLGPKGRNVLLDRAWEAPVVTKDGFRVAREIDPEDRFEKLGAVLVREASSRAYEAAGDGATTSTVIARALVAEGLRLVAAGFDPMSLRRGIGKAVNVVLAEVTRIAIPATDVERLTQVATIAANGDREVGEVVGRAMARVGKEGVLSIEESGGLETKLEFVEGLQIDRGYVSAAFVTDPARREACLEDARILIHDRRIQSVAEIVPVLEICQQTKKPLLVVAEKIEGLALQTLVANRTRGGLRCVAVESPAYTARRQTLLEDLAAVTGGQVVSGDLGRSLERIDEAWLGRAKQVVVTRDSTTVIGGGGRKADIAARTAEIRRAIAAAPSDLERERLEDRLASLLGGIAVVHVGGVTEIDLKEKKTRFEGAVSAVRAAMEEGIVAGGGAALLRAAAALDGLELPAEERPAIRIVRRGCEEPARWIARNGGYAAPVVVERIRTHKNGPGFGFDAAAGSFRDLLEAGIVDSARVVRVALQSAASIAALLLASGVGITESPSIPKDHLDPPKENARLRPRSGHLSRSGDPLDDLD